MFNFLKKSNIKFLKLFFHAIILTIILNFLVLLISDIISWTLGKTFENNTNTGFVTIIVMIWIFFALQNKRYQKEESDD